MNTGSFLDLCLAAAAFLLLELIVSVSTFVEAESHAADELSLKLVGRWNTTDSRRTTTKTFGGDGDYHESYAFLGTRVTITGIYRVEANQLYWTGQKLYIDRRGGDVLPPTRHARLNQEQKATIEWRNVDMFVIRSDRAVVYRRVRP
jgi:hypothetical protein